MPYVIDGYNLLWAIQKAGGPDATTDVQLCKVVARYLALVGEKGQIIFDGTGPRDKSPFDRIGGLEVFFAGAGVDADTIIEGKLKASPAPRRLTVVSSDRRIRRAARARRAGAVKSEDFWDSLCNELRHSKGRYEPAEKQQGISDSETDQWLDFFGLQDGD